MKFSWIIAASLLFVGSVFADDEKGKADGNNGAKVETKSTATVTVMVVDEDGNVIEKTESSESSDKGESKIKVEVIDGKQVVEVTLPDGTKKKIDINAGREGGPAGRVMRWVFRKDGEDAAGAKELAEVKTRVEKVLKDVDVNVQIDAENIADQVKAAMGKLKPLMLEEKEFGGEMLLEFSDLAFLIQEEDGEGETANDGEADSKNRPKRIMVQRLGAQDAGMAAVLRKLDELSKRLEKIESRLDELSKQ